MVMIAAESPLAALAEWLSRYRYGLRLSEQGTVVSVGDGIAWISGLPSVSMDEIVRLEDGSSALVFHLARNQVGAILLRQTERLTAGTSAFLTGRRLSIGGGGGLLGRGVDPLAAPLARGRGAQPARQGRLLRLCADRPETLSRGQHHRNPAPCRRAGLHHAGGRGSHGDARPEIPRAVLRPHRGRRVDPAGA